MIEPYDERDKGAGAVIDHDIHLRVVAVLSSRRLAFNGDMPTDGRRWQKKARARIAREGAEPSECVRS